MLIDGRYQCARVMLNIFCRAFSFSVCIGKFSRADDSRRTSQVRKCAERQHEHELVYCDTDH